MIDHMRAPSGGQDVSATQIREIIRAVRANRLINGPNVSLKRTPNGTVVSASASSAKKTKPVDRGRFAIESIDGTTATFKNTYCDIGAKTYYLGEQSCSINEEGSTFVCLTVYTSSEPSVPVFSVDTFQSFSELQAAQGDYYKAVIPLYKFEDGALECDFRTGPTVPAWEFSS